MIYAMLPRIFVATVLGGLCAGAVLAQGVPVADPFDQTRTSAFIYRADGLLSDEIIEPDSTALGLITTYTYDSFGHRVSVRTANVGGASGNAVFAARLSSNAYTSHVVTIAGENVVVPKGIFAAIEINALGQIETKTYDPRFGAVLSLTGPNVLTTQWQVDDFGRNVKEIRADGTSSLRAYCYIVRNTSTGAITVDTSATSASSPTCPTPAANEVPADAYLFVHSEPRNTAGLQNGPFTRVYSDRAGRKIRTVTQAFDGVAQPGGTNRLVVQDTDYSPYGVEIVSTQPYFLDTGSSASTGTSTYGATRTDVDVLGRPVAIYTADLLGSAGSQPFGSRDRRWAAKTRITYDRLTTNTINDKGQIKTEERNLDGKLIRVTDALGAQLAQDHDAFGNLVGTKDALQNTVTISYDARGRKVAMNDPDTGLWKYDYNALGELVWQQSPNQRAAALAAAQQTTMAYDKLGRMVQRVEPEYTSNWYYDQYADASVCNKGVGKLCESSTTSGVNRKFVYDSLGRPINSRTNISSGPSFASAISYDSANGRLATQTYPTGLTVNYLYTARGFLYGLTPATTVNVNPLPATPGGIPAAGTIVPVGAMLWEAKAYNAWGQAEEQKYANGVVSKAAFDAMTGRIASATAGVGTATNVLKHSYLWDSLSHLIGRTDANGDGSTGAVTDSFIYDSIGRLQSYAVDAPAIPSLRRTVTLQYNALGMLLYKSDVGIYTYGPQGAGQVRPHALQSVAGAINASYSYDANGNLSAASAGSYRSLAYTSFNLPDNQNGLQGPAGTPKYTWQYDENHQRIKETRVNGAGTRTTWNLHPDNQGGLGFEREVIGTNTAGAMNRHYLSVGGMSIGVIVSKGELPALGAAQTAPVVLATINALKFEYWHKDHLGSLAATTDHAGNLTGRYAYDPFGKRRMTNGRYDEYGTLIIDWTTNTNTGTDRGYTGHEHLDDAGLIHMNGRLFDPRLGLFMQADPLNQDPSNLQNFNRYGYCYNDPLTCTDPSGFSLWKKALRAFRTYVRPLIAVAVAIVAPEIVGPWITASLAAESVGMAATTAATVGAYAGAAVGGFAAGAINSGNIKGALQGAFSAAVFYGVGDFLNGQGAFAGGTKYGEWSVMGVSAHAVAGCVTSVASGGKCGPGALAAGVSQAALPLKMGLGLIGGTVMSAVIGGTASELGGGKFSNGAQTAAFAYLFGQCRQSPASCTSENVGKEALDITGKAWALPNTVVGLGVGLTSIPFGSTVTFGDNAIVLNNFPWGPGGAITIGNVILNTGDSLDEMVPTYISRESGPSYEYVRLGTHEAAHTYQYQVLGPLFAPAYLLSGGAFTSQSQFEAAADRYALTGKGWRP